MAIPAIDLTLTLDAGEPIWTESSYKFDPDRVVADGLATGFSGAERPREDILVYLWGEAPPC